MAFGSSLTPVTLTPNAARPCGASGYFSEALSSALDGMQPDFTHVPAQASRLATQAVVRPSWAQCMAHTYPPGAAPITITSYDFPVMILSPEKHASITHAPGDGKAAETHEKVRAAPLFS